MRKKIHATAKRRSLTRLAAMLPALIALIGMAIPASAAVKSVTVGKPSSYTTFVPVCTTWHDTWTETIYTSDMLADIPAGAVIKKIGYNGISTVNISDISYEVYVKSTTATTAPADHSDLSDFTCLYKGTTSIETSASTSASSPVLTVEAQNAFTYDGGNLHVVVKANIPELPASGVNFSYQTKQRSTLLTLSNNNWETYNKYTTYNYLPVMNLDVELPEGYIDLTKATVGDDGAYAITDMFVPLSFRDDHSMSSTLYKASQLAIPANMDIYEISYKGLIQSTSTGNHRIRVWMANTAETEVPVNAPALTAMTQVVDTTMVLDKKVGSYASLAEILRLKLKSPFRYTGSNLLIAIQADNETTQTVYFAESDSYAGQNVYGDGTSDDLSTFKFYAGNFPTTNIYYAAPLIEETPEIALVTEREAGKKLGFMLTSRDGVRVDWGGTIKEYPYGGTLTLNHDLTGNEIKIWPLSADDHIETFICNSGQITSAKLEAPGLKKLQLKDNLLDTLNIAGCPVIENLDLTGNKIFEFAAQSKTLRYLTLAKNGMEQLIITECSALEHLDVSINALRYPIWLFWPEAPNLSYLNISFNQVLNFDLTPYSKLKTLICNHNILSALNLAAVPGLEVLRAGFNDLKTLDVAKCPNLKVLDICGTSAGATRLNNNKKLEELNLRLTGISTVDLSANTALRYVNLSQNSLTSLDLSANNAIQHLDVKKNSLAALNTSNLRSLRFIDCSNNSLAALDLKNNTALDSLYCSVNKLTELPLPAGNHIGYIDFASNNISTQPANMEAVKYLNCADNKWTATDFSKTPAILGIDIHSNLLGKEALMTMFRQLPDINGIEIPEEDVAWMGVLNYNDNPGASEVSADIPETKGWNCSYKANFIGDASAAIVIPADKVFTRISFGIDTPDPVYYVDWGDGKKVEYKPENPQYTANSIVGFPQGQVVRIYAPAATDLAISNGGYEAVDVSGMPELRRLSGSGNQFTSLDFTSNSKIVDLNCRENPLTSIAFPADCKITGLDCSSTLLRSLDLSKVPLLEELAVAYCNLEELDLSKTPLLRELRAESNNLKSADLKGLTKLVNVYLSDNELTSVDITDNKMLEVLTVDYNNISTIDLSGHDDLKTVHANNNKLTTITIDNPMLSVLFVSDNNLETIDLAKAGRLTVITLDNNKLPTLDLTQNSMLAQVFAKNNKLTSVNFPSAMPFLKLLNVADNSLTSINLEAIQSVTELVASGNKLSGTLDFTKNTALNYLNVGHNAIEGFKWGTTTIATIYASYNKLSTLNVPSADLSVLDCSRNELEAVNLSRNTNLFFLNLDFNKLTSVNLSANKNLWGVSLRANELDATEIDKICTQLPDINDLGIVPGEEAWMKQLFLSGNPGCIEANVTPAVDKGWTVVMNEEIPFDRVLTLKVIDKSGAPVENAKLTLVVEGEDVGTKAVETQPGVYVYNPLPVFKSLSYDVRIEKENYETLLVDVTDVVEGDLTLTVTLLAKNDGVESVAADRIRVAGAQGCIKVSLPAATRVTVYDLTGRVVFNGDLPEGESSIDNLAPGIYITLGRKVNVF